MVNQRYPLKNSIYDRYIASNRASATESAEMQERYEEGGRLIPE